MLDEYSKQCDSSWKESAEPEGRSNTLEKCFSDLMFVVQNDNLDKLEEMARLYESLMISIDMQRELKVDFQLAIV